MSWKRGMRVYVTEVDRYDWQIGQHGVTPSRHKRWVRGVYKDRIRLRNKSGKYDCITQSYNTDTGLSTCGNYQIDMKHAEIQSLLPATRNAFVSILMNL